MEPIKVLWAVIDLEPLIVQFRTLAVGSSEEPTKVLIYRFFLESNGSSARSAYGSWKNPTSYQRLLEEPSKVRALCISTHHNLFHRLARDGKMSQLC